MNFIKLDDDKKEFVFFSESKFYREHFFDLISELKKKGENNLILITQDVDDLIYYNKIINCFLINNFFILKFFFIILKCKFMIMTLTDLGNNLLKSKKTKYYVYFYHAIASTHQIYTKEAFKNYDIIFTNGDYQSKELKKAETEFNFPRKEIVNTGYFFLDHIKKKAKLNMMQKRTILYAPSWNYNHKNLFDDYSKQIISNLIDKNFNLILRPHPEHYKRSKKNLRQLNDLFKNNSNFNLDNSFSNLNSLEKACILITDNSSIVFEYLMIFKRPIIYIEYMEKIHNQSLSKIEITTLDEELKNKFGNKLLIENLNYLPKLCEELIENSKINPQDISEFSNKHFTNLNNSSKFAANYLINKSKKAIK